jgi:hypothetical protein
MNELLVSIAAFDAVLRNSEAIDKLIFIAMLQLLKTISQYCAAKS